MISINMRLNNIYDIKKLVVYCEQVECIRETCFGDPANYELNN